MQTGRDFSRRRKAFLSLLPPASVAVIPAALAAIRNGGIEYPFRQDSNFFYLTGFPEPDAIAVLVSAQSEAKYILFCTPRDRDRELWEGIHPGCEEAVKDYGADEAYPLNDFETIFPRLLKSHSTIYWTQSKQRGQFWLAHLKRLRAAADSVGIFYSAEKLINEMRLRKSPSEIKLMKKAAEVSAKAHRRAMAACCPGDYEYAVEAEILAEFCAAGTVPAYPSIVGAGANACTLHYVKNNALLKDGEMLLVDAGAEYQNYASDITRSYPVNGCFSAAQKELYELVLAAQIAAISKVKPGNYFDEFHQEAVSVLTRGLVNLGLLKGTVKSLIKNQGYRRYYMHNTGHWLGIDVHDPGAYHINDRWRVLEPGMIVTVEPGLYIRPARDIDKRWWNIGVRIEDDVLVKAAGNTVLSDGVPKYPDDIEALMMAGN